MGSASATGSTGGRTTWASGSDMTFDQDRMGDDVDDGISSTGGFSDEGNASLVGFGEGANSTVSGPVSTGGPAARMSIASRQSSGMTGMGPASPSSNRASYTVPLHSQRQGSITSAPAATSSTSPAGSVTPEPHQLDDVRMVDGMTYDSDVVDTTARSPLPVDGRNNIAAEAPRNDGF